MSKTPSPRGITALPTLAIVLLVAIVIAGAAYLATRDQGNTNAVVTNSPANANAGNSGTDPTEGVTGGALTTDPVTGAHVFRGFGIQLTVPREWYTTEPSSGGNPSIVFTASTENTSDILGLRSQGNGILMHLLVEPYAGSAVQYATDHSVAVGSVISESRLALGGVSAFRREVDATTVESLEGSYSIEYMIPVPSGVARLLFLSLAKPGMQSHAGTIDEITSSLTVSP